MTGKLKYLGEGDPLQEGMYVLEKQLGKPGAFGTTFKAKRKDLPDEPIAIKVLHNFQQAERFQTECKILKKITLDSPHPHIVEYIDSFEEDGNCFLVMSFVPGETLNTYVNETGKPIPEKDAVQYIEQIGDALKFLHRQRLVHRDVALPYIAC